MAQLNSVQLVGRAGRDPQMRTLESGTALCTLTLAVNRIRRRGEETPPDWFDLELRGRTAEIAGEYVRKGALIGVSGALVYSRWLDRTSREPRERPLIRVDRLELLGRAAAGDAAVDPD